MIADKRIKSLIQNAIIDITQIVKDEKHKHINKNKKQLNSMLKNIDIENISQGELCVPQQLKIKSYFESMNKINDCLDNLTETE
jgi:hypothetical protein